MSNIVWFCIYLLIGSLDFGFAAKNLSDGHYIMFGIDLALGITLSLIAAALFFVHFYCNTLICC